MTCSVVSSTSGGGFGTAATAINVNSPRKSVATAATETATLSRRRAIQSHASAYAIAASAMIVATKAHSSPSESCAQAVRITAAAIVAAAWRMPLRTKSAVVLTARVMTSSAPRPGHGGVPLRVQKDEQQEAVTDEPERGG